MGIEDSAENRLRTLTQHLRDRPTTGRPERRTRATNPATPYNVTLLGDIQQAVIEVVEHTRAANPDHTPIPADIAAVYEWCRRNTRNAGETVALQTRTLEIRHRLDHAIAAGDASSVIRPLRCPACETFGLFWRSTIRRAVCFNRHCARDNDGISRKWTTLQLARREARAEKNLRECAT